MDNLARSFDEQFAASQKASETVLEGISDLRFTDTNRVPFPFQKLVREKLNVATLASELRGPLDRGPRRQPAWTSAGPTASTSAATTTTSGGWRRAGRRRRTSARCSARSTRSWARTWR